MVSLKLSKNYVLEFKKAMDNDFNTPEALAVLHEFSKEINKIVNSGVGCIKDLERIKNSGKLEELDIKRVRALSDYLVEIHFVKK